MKRGLVAVIAKKIELDKPFVWRIVHFKQPCPRKRALEFERITGVHRDLWMWGPKEELHRALDMSYDEDLGDFRGYDYCPLSCPYRKPSPKAHELEPATQALSGGRE